MRKKYSRPDYSVILVDIEESLCNASATFSASESNMDYMEEWEQLKDDERHFEWK